MSIFEDIFDTSTAVGKLTLSLTVLLALWLAATGVAASMLLYEITHPDVRGDLDPNLLLSKPEIVSIPIRGEKDREGWFFPGPTTSPTIILCPGYRTDRSDLITMVSALQKDRFNVIVFNFSGHGKIGGSTSLGHKEANELLAVVEVVLKRTDVDRTRVGVWGFDLGGYAAVAAAAAEPRIKAFAADSIYDKPRDKFDLLARDSVLAKVPLAATLARWGFLVLNWSARNEPGLMERVAALPQTAKLFIQGRDNPAQAEATLQLFLRASEPRKQSVMSKSNYTQMQDEERKAYETEVVHFFLEAIPPALIR
jgi:pimeloyl-ACP methyl ester carboxylesterase